MRLKSLLVKILNEQKDGFYASRLSFCQEKSLLGRNNFILGLMLEAKI